VIYGRVEGAALLANLAYPDGPALKPAILSVHGGRWRAGNRADASSIKVAQWAEFGFFAMSIDYRLVGICIEADPSGDNFPGRRS
jgi:acetyl esterase/lipase